MKSRSIVSLEALQQWVQFSVPIERREKIVYYSLSYLGWVRSNFNPYSGKNCILAEGQPVANSCLSKVYN